jgi:hypothetical protein
MYHKTDLFGEIEEAKHFSHIRPNLVRGFVLELASKPVEILRDSSISSK